MGAAHLWRLARGRNAVMGGLTVILGALATIREAWTATATLAVAGHTLSVVLFMAAANALNDRLDAEGDRINHPDRPLPSGHLQPSTATTFVIGGALLSALLAGATLASTGELGRARWWAAATWLFAAALILLYELGPRLKARPLVGNAAISLLVGLVIIHGAMGLGRPLAPAAWGLGAVAALVNLAREVAKDCEDMEGDADRRTYPRAVGLGRARVTAHVSALSAVAVLFLIHALEALPLAAILFQVPAIWLIMSAKVPLALGDDHRAQRRLRLALLAGLIGALPGIAWAML